MDQNSQVSASSLIAAVAEALEQNQENLNRADVGVGGGTHGTRMAQTFRAGAQAAQAEQGDARKRLSAAAAAMRQPEFGRASKHYADALQEAAAEVGSTDALSTDQIGPFLQGFARGAQKGNHAEPEHGTLLDAILPAANAYEHAAQEGMSPAQAATRALASAVAGARRTSRYNLQPGAGFNGNPGDFTGESDGPIDPGAASATTILGALFATLVPGANAALAGADGRATLPPTNDPLEGALHVIAVLEQLSGEKGEVGTQPAQGGTDYL